MDQLPALGTAIAALIEPTAKIYGELVSKNAAAIRATMRSTHQYGSHARQELDLYRPADFSKHADAPVVLFLHGGGFAFGDKQLPTAPEPGLVYANLGHYFADGCGYAFAAANYRLVGKHDAVYPSGGEDIAAAVEFLGKTLGPASDGKPRDLFVVGHSAGGSHLSTYLLEPALKDRVDAAAADDGPVRLRGVVFAGTPLDFANFADYRREVGAAYFGDKREQYSALGLLKAYQQAHPAQFPLKGVQVLVVDCELDPPDEIRDTNEAFLSQWLLSPNQDMKDALSYREVAGHNHISCVWGPGTGVEKEEGLGQEIKAFVDGIRRTDEVRRDIKIVQDSIKQ